MYPHLLSYNNYPTATPRSGYGYYPGPATRSINPHDRYFSALAEARAAEEEMLAEAAARREEELLQRRLNELRQSRRPQYSSHPLEPFCDASPHRPSNVHLESLKLQVEEEERQLAKLEAIRRRRLELEEEKRLPREIEEKLMLCGRPIAFETPEVTTNLYSHPNIQSGCRFYPETTNISYGKVVQQKKPESLVRFPLEESVRLPIDRAELPQKSQSAPRRKQRPSTPDQVVELDSLLQQLGFSLSTAENHPHEAEISQQTKASNVQPPKTTPKKTSAPRDPTTSHTSSVPVLDFGQLLNLLTGIGQGPQQEQKKQPPPHVPEVPRPKSPQTTLQEDLEKRLDNEHANEVRDTIQAILNSLQPQPAPTPARQPPVSTPVSPVSSDKGKSKEVPVARVEPKSPSPKDATERVQAIENRFRTLESEFTFPAKLDFAPASSNTTSTPATSHLAYTANNQPFRFYQQSLTHLLTQLDSIESFGNEELRNKRKEVVRKVEHALEDLEQEVEGRWNAKVAMESKKHRVTVEDVTLQEEEIDTSEPTPVPQVAEEESQSTPSAPVFSAPVPSQNTEKLAAPSLPEQSKTGVAEEPVIVEPPEVTSDTPVISQENFTLEPEETVVEDKAAEAVGIEESQSQSPPELEATEQSTEEPRTVTPLSTESTGPAPTPSPSLIPTPVDPAEVDLSATIRPLTPVIEDAPESDETESLNSESKANESESGDEGGFLLQNGPVEEKSLKLDFSDVESNVSDWSEVDVALAH